MIMNLFKMFFQTTYLTTSIELDIWKYCYNFTFVRLMDFMNHFSAVSLFIFLKPTMTSADFTFAWLFKYMNWFNMLFLITFLWKTFIRFYGISLLCFFSKNAQFVIIVVQDKMNWNMFKIEIVNEILRTIHK